MTQRALSVYQLKMYAKKWLKETYDMELTVPLELNGRLTKACGRFVYSVNNQTGKKTPKKIDLNKYFVENNESVLVLDVLRHELVHYALFMKGLPHSDGCLTFENELRRLGVVSQNTINKYLINSKPKTYIIYRCANGHEYKRQRKLQGDGKFHRCQCGGALKNMGKKVVTA